MEATAGEQPKGIFRPAEQGQQGDTLDRQVVALVDQLGMPLEERQAFFRRAVEALVELVKLEQHPRVGRVQLRRLFQNSQVRAAVR